VGLKFNEAHQLLVYTDDVNLLEDNLDTIEKNTEALIDASKEVGLEINVEKTKHVLLSRHQNAGQNRDIKITNRLFANVSQFRYFGTTVTNQDLTQEKIKRRLNFGNACYHSVQHLLSYRLLSKNEKIRIYKYLIVNTVYCNCFVIFLFIFYYLLFYLNSKNLNFKILNDSKGNKNTNIFHNKQRITK
jgi:hypothetical protein